MRQSYDMNEIVGEADIAFLVLDTLRYDVAVTEFEAGNTPNFRSLFPDGWEKRHSPGNFTYPAHHAFFAGFLPTPSDSNVRHDRLFASEFAGSETTGAKTFGFPSSNIVEGLAGKGYHTVCVGGVGFFNRRTALSCVFPDLFEEDHWSEETGVTAANSTRNQIEIAADCLQNLDESKRIFLYMNISAIHQPNCFYVEGKTRDDMESHAAALRYVDSQIPTLIETLTSRSDTFLIVCSDHGTLYGEDGFTGHRVGHDAVFTVPYGEVFLPKNPGGFS